MNVMCILSRPSTLDCGIESRFVAHNHNRFWNIEIGVTETHTKQMKENPNNNERKMNTNQEDSEPSRHSTKNTWKETQPEGKKETTHTKIATGWLRWRQQKKNTTKLVRSFLYNTTTIFKVLS